MPTAELVTATLAYALTLWLGVYALAHDIRGPTLRLAAAACVIGPRRSRWRPHGPQVRRGIPLR